jgi:hypothetical protein
MLVKLTLRKSVAVIVLVVMNYGVLRSASYFSFTPFICT